MNSKSVKLNYDFDKKKYKKRRSKLTVCIAVINNGIILGASDRMVTANDIEFEPPVPKILTLTTSIVVLTAGDQSIQIQVFQEAYKRISAEIADEPKKWIDVSHAAEVYSECFYELRNKMIQNSIFSHYNLTFDSYISKQKQMSDKFIEEIDSKIARLAYSLGDIETIITGIDTSLPHATDKGTSPHIYVVKNGEVSCHDKLGFVSIGAGSSHAESHLMLSNYTVSTLPSSTLLTVHQAKKKSEVCPGVGKETDMFLIGGLGGFGMLEQIFGEDTIEKLDGFYGDYEEKIENLNKDTEEQIRGYFDKLIKAMPKPKQEPGASLSPSASASASPSSESEEGNET